MLQPYSLPRNVAPREMSGGRTSIVETLIALSPTNSQAGSCKANSAFGGLVIIRAHGRGRKSRSFPRYQQEPSRTRVFLQQNQIAAGTRSVPGFQPDLAKLGVAALTAVRPSST
jgi:hypothetical protein